MTPAKRWVFDSGLEFRQIFSASHLRLNIELHRFSVPRLSFNFWDGVLDSFQPCPISMRSGVGKYFAIDRFAPGDTITVLLRPAREKTVKLFTVPGYSPRSQVSAAFCAEML
jgi:hypothetical protein